MLATMLPPEFAFPFLPPRHAILPKLTLPSTEPRRTSKTPSWKRTPQALAENGLRARKSFSKLLATALRNQIPGCYDRYCPQNRTKNAEHRRNTNMLTNQELDEFSANGHVTVPAMFTFDGIDRVLADLTQWSTEVLSTIDTANEKWYLEPGSSAGQPVLRKLDNPVYHREAFRTLANAPKLLTAVRQILGGDVCVCFSQVFNKPPEVGGPKPIHQDNFYFGPNDPNAMVTAWIALDDADQSNGCLFYGKGSHRLGLLPHVAPESEPFNLQVEEDELSLVHMTAAPVPRGGVSFHHGFTLHQSSANTSKRFRRAVAIHYLKTSSHLATPALPYDETLFLSVTPS